VLQNKMQMKDSLYRSRYVLGIFVLIWIILGAVLLIWDKKEIHLFLNQFHTVFFDLFFRTITFFGNGFMIAALALIFLFVSFRKAIIIGVSGALSGLLAQFFKRVVFSNIPRPKAFFDQVSDLYFVPGVDVHSSFSFPSGHSATVFSLFFILILYTKNKVLQILLLFVALLTGYSRIYLSQHFLIDVYFGGLLGIFISITIFTLINKLDNLWIDKSLVSLFKD
jgi:membrane-associated phospholipid phosphatase